MEDLSQLPAQYRLLIIIHARSSLSSDKSSDKNVEWVHYLRLAVLIGKIDRPPLPRQHDMFFRMCSLFLIHDPHGAAPA
jgi:hypothetical protein